MGANIMRDEYGC